MILDKKRSFAHIYGHPNASYEQDGKLFNGAGVEVKFVDVPHFEEDSNESVPAEVFLKNLLHDTSMSKSKIANIAESSGVSWIDIETASVALNVFKKRQGVGEIWKLTDE